MHKKYVKKCGSSREGLVIRCYFYNYEQMETQFGGFGGSTIAPLTRPPFPGPAALCQRPRRAVPLSGTTQRAEQSGARTAALEETSAGAAQVRLRPACGAQLGHAGWMDGGRIIAATQCPMPSCPPTHFLIVM